MVDESDKDAGDRANVEGEGASLTKTDDLEVMLSFSEPVLTQKSVNEELQTPKANLFHHTLAKGLKVLDDVSVGHNSQNDEFERVTEE